ncbi:hypothetical protein BR93DRAFT_723882 [Coniochaeta sp. PMI_546]|nr:hypothetical protein BR93DRAFT_723882 [Coniochaeta sp. PMI_546]
MLMLHFVMIRTRGENGCCPATVCPVGNRRRAVNSFVTPNSRCGVAQPSAKCLLTAASVLRNLVSPRTGTYPRQETSSSIGWPGHRISRGIHKAASVTDGATKAPISSSQLTGCGFRNVVALMRILPCTYAGKIGSKHHFGEQRKSGWSILMRYRIRGSGWMLRYQPRCCWQ